MRPLLACIGLALCFVIGASVLDERRTSFGALPYMPHETSATKAGKWSWRAIDRERETLWIAKDGRDDVWTLTLAEPTELIGVSIDTSFFRSFGANEFRVHLTPPDGERRSLYRKRHDRIFSCWHQVRLDEPFLTRTVELEVPHIGREAGASWALRDVRLLVDGIGELPESERPPLLAALLEGGALPFGLGVLWILFLYWRQRVGRESHAQ